MLWLRSPHASRPEECSDASDHRDLQETAAKGQRCVCVCVCVCLNPTLGERLIGQFT